MKFIKTFEKDTEYVSYRDGGSYEMPNISYSRGSDKVYYNVDANKQDYVDLGLPSGTLWATRNVGASKPSEYGLYFTWGDIIGYTSAQVGKTNQFVWSDYKWNPKGDGQTFEKYTITGATLDLEDDAAQAYKKGDWHMPTPEQIQELIENTTTAWTETDDVYGVNLTSANGKSIFIPAAGSAYNGSVDEKDDSGYFWSSMLSSVSVPNAQYFNFASDGVGLSISDRFIGYSVRGVLG